MYYQNGNYMQDLNYYNQNPNVGYQPYVNHYQNGNPQMPMGQGGNQNLNAMYPAVYRIISPVVSQVLLNNNMGYLTEDNLNSMVDTVYQIVEGDVNLANYSNPTNTQNNTNSNDSNCSRNASNSTPSSSHTSTTTSSTNGQNTLLRDLIKIMILNEILSRRQNRFSPMMMPNNNMTQPMFM